MMTVEECRDFWVRWFDGLYGRRDPSIIDECVAEDCRIDGLPAVAAGRASFHAFYRVFAGAFPEVRIEIEDILVSGESFAMRCSGQVRDHDGRTHAIRGCAMGKMRDRQIVEAWNHWEFHHLLESMGVLPQNIVLTTFQSESAKGAGP
jgi:hypothetical protein